MSVSVQYEHLHTILSVQPILFGISVGQREHIIPVNSFDHVGKWSNFNYKFHFVVLRWSEVCCHS